VNDFERDNLLPLENSCRPAFRVSGDLKLFYQSVWSGLYLASFLFTTRPSRSALRLARKVERDRLGKRFYRQAD
jgi:hypothetical protein